MRRRFIIFKGNTVTVHTITATADNGGAVDDPDYARRVVQTKIAVTP